MNSIKIPVQAYILGLMPKYIPPASQKQTLSSANQLKTLADGIAVPSFWEEDRIKKTFEQANKIWDQAKIAFTPVTISRRTECVAADEDGMWIDLVNKLTPNLGVGVAFVSDLPSDEGGWGGGRMAAVMEVTEKGTVPGLHGSILAHELGHILLGINHSLAPGRLMFGERYTGEPSQNLLGADEITNARKAAQALPGVVAI